MKEIKIHVHDKKPVAKSIKTPFSVRELEKMFTFAMINVPIRASSGNSYVKISEKTISKPVFRNVREPLLTLSNELGEIVGQLNENGNNYALVFKRWAVKMLQGILEYRKLDMRFEKPRLDYYEALYDKYSEVFKRAMIAEDISAEDNYEDLEFGGDSVYKCALTDYLCYEKNIQNKASATFLRHHFERTKALANLAQIFHMEPLMRSAGSKQKDALSEDVFESMLRVFHNVQKEIMRNPGNPEFIMLAGDNGFAGRMVRMVFNCTTVDFDIGLPSKTFITTLQHLGDSSDKLQIIDRTKEGVLRIVFHVSQIVASSLAMSYGISADSLMQILNATYVGDGSNAKDFATAVYDKIVEKLEAIGLSKTAVQEAKNAKTVPRELRERLSILSTAASELGYWVGINIPKNVKSRAGQVVQATLYHNIVDRCTRRVEVGMTRDNSCFVTLFDKLELLIDRAPNISNIVKHTEEIATENEVHDATSTVHEKRHRQPKWKTAAAETIMGL